MTDTTSLKLSKPPLVEALIGIEFSTNPGFSGFLLGGFWAKVSDVFTKPGLRDNQAGSPRIKLVSADHNLTLQILDSGFFLSWVVAEGDKAYPGFASLLGQFQELYSKYIVFLSEAGFPVPPITALSMGYTNLISKPPEHEGLLVSSVFPDFQWRASERGLPAPAFVNLGASFQFPEEGCLVDVKIDGPFPSDDPELSSFLRLFLQAKGTVEKGTELEKVWNWYKNAKASLNRTFSGLTSKDFRRKYWGEEN